VFIMKRAFAFLALLYFTLNLSATHNRAGEITYEQLSDLTYRFTITTFTYTLSFADRPQLEVSWGDNSTSIADRQVPVTKLPNFYQKNVYIINHTFPGPGVYKIVVQDPNRNYGVRNIPNSVNVVFSITTTLIVNPSMGLNNTPILLNPPYDKAALGYVFIHNPAAYDPDGDSLSYKLTTCTKEDGKPIENYVLPPATEYIRIDSITGDLIWNTPADTGIYNVAIEIQEWRAGKKIGVVVRDMQIEVYITNNKPPVNSPLVNRCVEVGQEVSFTVSATDENNDVIFLKATSGVFSMDGCPASFTQIDTLSGSAFGHFSWTPCFASVRNQPYNILFKSEDQNSELPLADIDNMTIKVLGPSPLLLNAVPEGKFIRLSWAAYGTDLISGFNIYRREGASSFVPDSCTSGIPPTEGFLRVGYVAGSDVTDFTDTENGDGLQFGSEYTYRITAVFKNGAESKASNEITSTLVSGIPIIKNVTVLSTNTTLGSIYLEWRKPQRLDTIPAPGPWEYIIYRAQGISSSDFQQIASIPTTDLNDTTFTDAALNTIASGYLYKIELWNRTPGNEFLIGDPGVASSLFITVAPGDRKNRFVIARNVPWINNRYDIFRYNNLTLSFDSVGTTNQLTYTDLNLENGTEYCYYVRSTGAYLSDDMPKGLINLSQEACSTPVDNEPPCPPDITVTSECDSLYNTVRWTIADPVCFADVAGYKVYYKQTYDENLSLLINIDDKNIMQYRHFPGDLVSGCYAVSAFDSVGNEGLMSAMVCVDSCNFFEIPNVFTPNGDDINDRLLAKTSGLVEKIDFKLFNRNGLLIYSTQNPRIDWDGTYNGKIVSPGVYFYQCDVFEQRITGIEQFRRSGFIHVITEEGARVKQIETK